MFILKLWNPDLEKSLTFCIYWDTFFNAVVYFDWCIGKYIFTNKYLNII